MSKYGTIIDPELSNLGMDQNTTLANSLDLVNGLNSEQIAVITNSKNA